MKITVPINLRSYLIGGARKQRTKRKRNAFGVGVGRSKKLESILMNSSASEEKFAFSNYDGIYDCISPAFSSFPTLFAPSEPTFNFQLKCFVSHLICEAQQRLHSSLSLPLSRPPPPLLLARLAGNDGVTRNRIQWENLNSLHLALRRYFVLPHPDEK